MEVTLQIFQILFYFASTIAIIYGLTTWNLTLKGKNKYECAKDIIIGTYRIRDEINHCRSPFMFYAEWAERVPQEGETKQEKEAEDSYFAYAARFSKVTDAWRSLEPSLIEAEALFGSEARRLCDKLLSVIKELSISIQIYHMSLKEGNLNSQEKSRNIISANHPKMEGHEQLPEDYIDDGGFQDSFDKSITSIRNYFLQFIK